MKYILLILAIAFFSCKKENQAPSFNTILTFTVSEQMALGSINGTVAAKNPVLRFAFDSLPQRIGLPQTINISVGSTLMMVIDYPDDYNGRAYKFTNADGRSFAGTFKNGEARF